MSNRIACIMRLPFVNSPSKQDLGYMFLLDVSISNKTQVAYFDPVLIIDPTTGLYLKMQEALEENNIKKSTYGTG